MVGLSPRNVAGKLPGRAGDGSSLDSGDLRHSRSDHQDPAMTAHLSRRDTASASTQRTATTMGCHEMTNEAFVRREYDGRRETMKPSHVDPGSGRLLISGRTTPLPPV